MTQFADYNYYKDEFKGTLIPEVEADYCLSRGSDVVDWKSGKKASHIYDTKGADFPDFTAVQDATCAIAEEIYRLDLAKKSEAESGGGEEGCVDLPEGARISAESVDGFSINYDLPFRADSTEAQSQFERKINALFHRYLDFTYFGYSGVKTR